MAENIKTGWRLLSNLSVHEAADIKGLSKWISDVGNGKNAKPKDGEALIDIPNEFPITEVNDPIESITRAVYGDLSEENTDPNFFQKRAILCPRIDDVNMINNHMISKQNGEERTYLSSDRIDLTDSSATTELLNRINLPGFPNHSLRLKIGTPVMLLKDLLPNEESHSKGTRLQITRMAQFVLQARVITGNSIGELVLIPRLPMTPSDPTLSIEMRRKQFPLSVAFAMTIDESRGQTLSTVGLFLPRQVFPRGQLCEAISRVKSKSDKRGNPKKKTMHVVFKEVSENL